MISLRRSRSEANGYIPCRRNASPFLQFGYLSTLAVIGGILGVIGGGAILSSTVRRQEDWLTASALHDLPDNEPTAVTLSVTRLDGYRESLQRRTIFLVKTENRRLPRSTPRARIWAVWLRGIDRVRSSGVRATAACSTGPAR